MPKGDKTGPVGMGPMTGRGAGFGNGFVTPGYIGPAGYGRGFGYGYGRGFGRGRGRRGMFRGIGTPGWDPRFTNAEQSAPYDEKAALTNQAVLLENQLRQVKEQLSKLDPEPE